MKTLLIILLVAISLQAKAQKAYGVYKCQTEVGPTMLPKHPDLPPKPIFIEATVKMTVYKHANVDLTIPSTYLITYSKNTRNSYGALYESLHTDDENVLLLSKIADYSTWKDMPDQLFLVTYIKYAGRDITISHALQGLPFQSTPIFEFQDCSY